MSFTAIKLTPGAPFSVSLTSTLVVKQVALAAPAKPGTVAVVSLQTNAGKRVLCTLRAGQHQAKLDVVISPSDQAILLGNGGRCVWHN